LGFFALLAGLRRYNMLLGNDLDFLSFGI